LLRAPALLLGVASLAAGIGSASAQTIVVKPDQLTAVGNLAPGQDAPDLLTGLPGFSTGECIGGSFRPISWYELTFTVATAGTYSAVIEYANPFAQQTAVNMDLRAQGSNLHYSTGDITLANTGGDLNVQNTAPQAGIPLQAGTYVLRMQNTSGAHTIPHATGVGGDHANMGTVTFTRTGALAASGTLSGKVSASDLGVPVASAYVMADAAGKTVAEPGPFWYHGFWTTTDSGGNYSLSVPTGAFTVQAGRPDTYALAGAASAGVNVAAGGATANLSLASRWASNSLRVESEYFFSKIPDTGDNTTGLGFTEDANASNGYNLGYVDAGDYAVVNVDAPSDGFYSVGSVYQNGGVDGVVRYTTDRGSSTQDTQVNSGGWSTTTTKAFANPIYLFKGHNTVKQALVSGNSNFDAVTFTKTTNAGTSARLEAESFTNFGSGDIASVTGGSSGISIDTTPPEKGQDNQNQSGSSIGFYNGGEYAEYTVDAPQDGLYNITARGSFAPEDLTLTFRNLSYGPSIDEPFNIPANPDSGVDPYGAANMNQYALPNPIALKAGPNVIRVYESAGYGFNADYYSFDRTSDLTGYGMVQGTVTAGGQPVARAEIYANLSGGLPPGGVADGYGFRSITDAAGHYNLLLPVGSYPVTAAAQNHDDPTATGAMATVSVTDGGTATQNFTLPTNGKYEAEWFVDGEQNPNHNGGAANGHGFNVEIHPDADFVSNNQTIGNFNTDVSNPNSPGYEYMDFDVQAPADGLYTITVQAASAFNVPVRVENLATHSQLNETIPGTGGFGAGSYAPFTFTAQLPMTAGVNRIRITNADPLDEGLNLDYFTVTQVEGGHFGTLTGTVTNGTVTGNPPVSGVAITVTDATSAVVGSATTDAAGKYTILLPAGSYTVTPSKTGFSGAAKPASISGSQTTTVDFSLVQGAVSGKVTDQSGAAIVGTVVTATDSGGAVLNTATTDANGAYSMALPTGAANLSTGAPMSIPAKASVTVGAATTQNLVVTRLQGGTPVSITYDQDFFSEKTSVTAHTVDGPYSLPAEVADWDPQAAHGPGAVTIDGVPFTAPDVTGSNLNVMSLVDPNNVVTVPTGKFAAMVVIGTSSGPGSFPLNGPGDATVTYSDNSTGTAPFFLADWGTEQSAAVEPRIADETWGAIRFARRHIDPNNGNGDGYNFRMFSCVIPLDPTKQAVSVTLPADDTVSIAPNPFVWAISMANAASATQPLGLARQALRIAGGLDAAPAAGATFNALNVVTTGASAGKIDIADAVALAKEGK
jgi:hypothetical protein